MRRVLILISTAVLLISTGSRPLGARAGQATTFKNIKVLTELSDDEIENAMLYMRGSLGVNASTVTRATTGVKTTRRRSGQRGR